MSLVFDIETVGADFDKLNETSQKSLTRWIRKEAKTDKEYEILLEDLKNGLGFSPLTGEIVALGVLDSDKEKGVVYFQSPDKETKEFEKGNFTFKPASEKEMLSSFWQGAANYQEFVSFNGRTFDVPFILIRSAKHGIKPTKDLMSNRYLKIQKFAAKHIDLLDQLSFYGAVRKKGSLHLWTELFGIESPKVKGVDGDEVKGLFKNKEYEKIAEYNSWDLTATKELYDVWRKYLYFE